MDQLERETWIEPATFSLGSGVGYVLLSTYPAFFETREPIEPTICHAGKKLGPIWTNASIQESATLSG